MREAEARCIARMVGPGEHGSSVLQLTIGESRTHVWCAGVDDVIAAVDRLRDAGHLYLGVARRDWDLVRNEKIAQGKAPIRRFYCGGAASTVGIPGLWLDVDTADGVHAASKLPSKDEARRYLEKHLCPPSTVIDTGGGLHAHWLLDELWKFAGPDDRTSAQDLAMRLDASVRGDFDLRGWHLDKVGNLARLLRVPGSLNHKSTPPKYVHCVENNGPAYSRDDLDRCFPPAKRVSPRSVNPRPTPAVRPECRRGSRSLAPGLIFELAIRAGMEVRSTGDKRPVLCPFHDDRRPSAFLAVTNIFYCSVCTPEKALTAKEFAHALRLPWPPRMLGW